MFCFIKETRLPFLVDFLHSTFSYFSKGSLRRDKKRTFTLVNKIQLASYTTCRQFSTHNSTHFLFSKRSLSQASRPALLESGWVGGCVHAHLSWHKAEVVIFLVLYKEMLSLITCLFPIPQREPLKTSYSMPSPCSLSPQSCLCSSHV